MAAYPQAVESLVSYGVRPVSVECGDNVVLVLSDAGELWGWGTGETMQLCRREPPAGGTPPATAGDRQQASEEEDVPAPVKLVLPFQRNGQSLKVKSISVCDINCACLVEDSSVYVWGWDFGQYPSKLVHRRPASGHNPATALPGAATPMEEVRWDRVTLGHTRMLLMTP